FTRRRDVGMPLDQVGRSAPRNGDAGGNHCRVGDGGAARRAQDGLPDRIALAHVCTANTGLMRTSMLNRSPGSPADRVVGAKNVARVKCGDCSIRRINEGASCVMPMICSLSLSTRSSVT